MDKRTNRIAAFIESLPMDKSVNGTQSVLLCAETAFGEGINEGNCYNSFKEQCKGATNTGTCKNMNGTCGDSSNGNSCQTFDKINTNYNILTCKNR